MKRKLLPFLLGLLVPVLACAEPITQEITFKQLGRKDAIQIMGYSTEQSIFIPLPVANLDLANTSLRFLLQCSTKIDRRSSVEVLVDDQHLADIPLGPGETPTVTLPLASLQGRRVPGNFLKLTLRSELRHPTIDARCHLWLSRDLWFSIQPESGLRTTFDNQSPDWLSVGRLPVTLRQEYKVERNPALEMPIADLALKVRGWLAFARPELEASTLQSQPGDASRESLDIVEFRENKENTPARIEIEAEGTRRRIILYARSEADAAVLWKTLREIGHLSIPSNRWLIPQAQVEDRAALGSATIRLNVLEPGFCDEIRGLGTMSKIVNFDSALFGRGKLSGRLRLRVRHLPVTIPGSGVLSLHVNDRLMVSRQLPVGSDLEELDVEIPAHLLQEENQIRVAVHYNPTEGECRNPLFIFYYQIANDATLEITEEGQIDPRPEDLIRGARRYFARNQYQVLLDSRENAANWEAAFSLVSWLQKVNARALIDPTLVTPETSTDTKPLVLIGRGENPVWQSAGGSAPILPEGEQLVIHSGDDTRSFRITPSASLGVVQFGYRRAGFAGEDAMQPIIAAYGWGDNGSAALTRTAAEMSSLGWTNFGNAVVGDGVSPLYSFDSKVVKLEVDSRPVNRVELGWQQWRWWITVPLWVGTTLFALWLLSARKKKR